MKNGRNLTKTPVSGDNLIFSHFCILTISFTSFTTCTTFTTCTPFTHFILLPRPTATPSKIEGELFTTFTLFTSCTPFTHFTHDPQYHRTSTQ